MDIYLLLSRTENVSVKMPPKQVRRPRGGDDEEEEEEDQNERDVLAAAAAQAQPPNAARRARQPVPLDLRQREQSTNWVFTAHGQPNWNILEHNPETGEYEPPAGIQFLAYQRENGAQQGGMHWQGYVVFHRRVDRNTAMRRLGLDPAHTWMHIRHGTHAEALRYVIKNDDTTVYVEGGIDPQGDPIEPAPLRFVVGVEPQMDAPGGFRAAALMAASGAPMRKIIEAYPEHAARCMHHLQKMSLMNRDPPADRNVKVKVYWGDTGTGKSLSVYNEARDLGIKLYKKIRGSDSGTIFFEGYTDQEGLLLDEFEGSKTFSLSFLLELLDRHPLTLNTKGTHEHALFTHVWICSNIDPEMWYPNANKRQLVALWRRLNDKKNIWHFKAEEEEEKEDESLA